MIHALYFVNMSKYMHLLCTMLCALFWSYCFFLLYKTNLKEEDITDTLEMLPSKKTVYWKFMLISIDVFVNISRYVKSCLGNVEKNNVTQVIWPFWAL